MLETEIHLNQVGNRVMSMELERKPLPVDSFPPNLQMHIKEDAPAKMKTMAAQGMVPAPPAQQVQVLYQLHFDDQFRDAVADSLAGMPPNVLLPIIQDDQPESMLDWMGEVLEEPSLVEAIVLNKNTADATIYELAGKADGELCELISNNQVRVLRSPAIIEALYKNTDARMATVDKLIDLAQRNEVDLSPFPELTNALKGAAEDDEEGIDDSEFSELLNQESEKVQEENKILEKLNDENLTRSERDKLEKEVIKDEEEDSKRAGNIRQKIAAMNIAQKIRLATVGSREAIKILVRDPNKLIHMAAIQSPRIKLGDVKRLSSNKSLPDGVINYMAKKREWTSDYEVLVNLTMNPKTPLSEVTGFLKHLRKRDLRKLSRNRNVSHQVSRMAKRMMKRRRR